MSPFSFFARKKNRDPDEELSESDFGLQEDYEEEEAVAIGEEPEPSDTSEELTEEPEEEEKPAPDEAKEKGDSGEKSEDVDSLLSLFEEETKDSALPDFIWEELREVETSELLRECMRVKDRLGCRV